MLCFYTSHGRSVPRDDAAARRRLEGVVAARVRVVVEGRLARRPHEIAKNAPRDRADRRPVREILEGDLDVVRVHRADREGRTTAERAVRRVLLVSTLDLFAPYPPELVIDETWLPRPTTSGTSQSTWAFRMYRVP